MSTSADPPPDQTMPQILAALQAIAAAVNRGTDVLVDPADTRAPSQEQSTAIVDYLVLRELVGRQADGIRRTVAATRSSDGNVVFDGDIPATATKVAVFTRRSIAPDEVAEISSDGGVDLERTRRPRGGRGSGGSSGSGGSGSGGGGGGSGGGGSSGGGNQPGIVLGTVTDDQPIVRLELRSADDLAVALGPRLAPVT